MYLVFFKQLVDRGIDVDLEMLNQINISEYAMMLLVCLLLFVCGTHGFKTGLEEGLICNVCVGTHPGA